jgi:predicted DNA-binding protein (UPF0251 family)
VEYSRARGKLPPELDGLLASQVAQAIDEANLGLADTYIAKRRFVDQMLQIDIACEMGLSRKTVNRRLQHAIPKIGSAAAQFNIPQ